MPPVPPFPVALAAVVLGLSSPGAVGDRHECDGLVIPVHGSAYLVVGEVLGEHYLYSVWLYQESNGIPGLQRGGFDCLGQIDICQSSPTPDVCWA